MSTDRPALPEDLIAWGDYFPDVPEDLSVLSDLEAACLAASAISALSENCWCAGWLDGAGASAWRFSFMEEPTAWGQGELSANECAALARLRVRLGGLWPEWVDDGVRLVDGATLQGGW